jgi:hypothetical protein
MIFITQFLKSNIHRLRVSSLPKILDVPMKALTALKTVGLLVTEIMECQSYTPLFYSSFFTRRALNGQYVVPKSNLWYSPTNVFPAPPLETYRGGKQVSRDVTLKTEQSSASWMNGVAIPCA